MALSRHPLLAGLLSGFIATIPQTAALELARQTLPGASRGRFPPRQVTEGVMARLAHRWLVPRLSEPTWHLLTTISHFGYGSSMGAIYAFMPARPTSVPLRGAIYGLFVWAGSYFVLLPALGIVAPQADQPVRKNVQLIAGHIAWGIANAMMFTRLTRGKARS